MTEEDFRSRPLGVIPSPKDDRDYNITRLISQIPSEIEEEPFEYDYKDYIKNQGNIGQCVSASGSAMREIIEKKQSKEYKRFSLGFNYGFRDETDYQGIGMIPREYLKNLITYGIPEYKLFSIEKEWPLIQTEVNNSNIPRILENAYPNRITAFARVYTPAEIKLALRTLGPLMVVVPVYQSFYDVSAENNFIVPKYTNFEKYFGMHAMMITGDNDQKRLFKCANSWGTGFGDKGFCYFDYDWPFAEVWAITDSVLPFDDYEITVSIDRDSAIIGEVINYTAKLTNGGIPQPNEKVQITCIDSSNNKVVFQKQTDNNGCVYLEVTSNTVGNMIVSLKWGIYTRNITCKWLDKPEPKPQSLWHVQVGAFAKKSNADALAAELKAKGYSVYAVQYSSLNK